GGDLSDPVVQATLRVVKVFWGLEASLAYKRHFPAINWLRSYSLYYQNIDEFLREKMGEDWIELRTWTMEILQKEAELEEIARLIGVDSLSPENRIIMETAKSIREDFLHQNGFHEVDSYCSPSKMYKMVDLIYTFHKEADSAVKSDVDIKDIIGLPVRENIARIRYVKEEDVDKEVDQVKNKIIETFSKL
ncbi:MAG TPA: V-type ATP synthase subunit A, partial [Spirochaetia bacterium]|nr:V-type ATP synthase subunit A [Spirochaetia bacterium]